jgi:hypothetical protein
MDRRLHKQVRMDNPWVLDNRRDRQEDKVAVAMDHRGLVCLPDHPHLVLALIRA